eukprot:m.378074 g.378074  ORF g.378074 m.378074 type:complete len:61 (+) comp20928_c0_seq20:67-249(+)
MPRHINRLALTLSLVIIYPWSCDHVCMLPARGIAQDIHACHCLVTVDAACTSWASARCQH